MMHQIPNIIKHYSYYTWLHFAVIQPPLSTKTAANTAAWRPGTLRSQRELRVNLFANVQINDHFTVGIYGKNLSDDLAATDGIGTFQDPQSLVAVRPRTFGFNVRWTY